MKIKKIMVNGMAICLSTVAFAGLAACGEKDKASGVSYVSIDVNPSISLVLDEKNAVLSVTADNEDAQVLLYGEQIVGLSVEKALETIAELSVEMEYLHDGNYGVNVVAEGKIDGAKLQNAVKTAFDAATAEYSFDVQYSDGGLFSVQRELDYVNGEYNLNLSVGEYRLIVEAMEADKSLTVQAAANLSTKELLSVIADKAEKVEPYATKAYQAAKAAAVYAYENGKASLIDKLWLTPYLNVFKYNVNNGAIYNLYSDAARVMTIGLDAAEAAAEIKQATEISQTQAEEVANALGLADEEKSAFMAAVTVDGKITLASLDGYLDAYFKNMTADERAAAKAQWEAAKVKMQAIATEVRALVNAEYADELDDLIDGVDDLIPDELEAVAGVYLKEFTATLNEISQNINGKDPMAAAYAARDVFKAKAAETYQKMRTELKKGGDLERVEGLIANTSESLAALEAQMNAALAQAEAQAKEQLAALKASRKSA